MILSEYLKQSIKIEWTNFDYEKLVKDTKISSQELNTLKLPKRFSTVEMAERIRVPLKSNVFPKISLELTPYLRDPISLIGDPTVSWIFIIAPTQSGKTVFLQTVVADAIEQDPGTLLYIYPDEKNGKDALQEKVINMIYETPFLFKHTKRPFKTTMSTQRVSLDNMTIYPAWSGSLGSISSKPAKKIVLDEIRLMKLTIGKESNAVKLANDRLKTFKEVGQAQAYGVSTPSVIGDLLYTQMEVPGTLTLHWHIKCKHCGRFFVPLFFSMLKSSQHGKAVLNCPMCNKQVEEGYLKKELNRGGAYGIKRKHFGAKSIPPVKDLKKGYPRVVFRYCSMSSPFTNLQSILDEYHATIGKVADYKNFWQCWLAEFWEDDISETSSLLLEKRVQPNLRRGTVPLETKFLTAGVDTQDDGLAVSVWAWTADYKYMIDSYFVECDIKGSTSSKLKIVIDKKINSRKWNGWMLALWAIDIRDGDHTDKIRSATCDFTRCCNVMGIDSKAQPTNIVYRRELDYYSIKRASYLQETERVCTSDEYILYDRPDKNFFTQFPNTRKVKEQHKKTGQDIITWKKCGKDDYRSAVTYAFLCLDIVFDSELTLRDFLDEEGYTYNPAIILSIDKGESGDLGMPKYSEPSKVDKEYYDEISPYDSMSDDGWMDSVLKY